jgi:diguanylate cyclase (GGDEF)-like protein
VSQRRAIALRSLGARIALLFLALMLVVQLAGFALIRTSIDLNARRGVAGQLEVGARVFGRLLAQNADTLQQGARILAADYGFREAVASDDRDTLASALANHGERIGANVSMYWSTEPALRASTFQPGGPVEADRIEALVRAAAAAGDGARGAALIDGHLHQIVVVPVRAPLPIGWVVMGFPVDRALATDLRALSSLQVSFVAGGAAVPRAGASPAAPLPALRVLASTLSQAESAQLAQVAARAADRPGNVDTVRLGGSDWGTLAVPIEAGPGVSVHALLQRSIDEAIEPYSRLQTTLLLLTGAGLLVSVIGSVLTARRISRPLADLAEAARRLGAGELGTAVAVRSDDEVGQLARSFETMRVQLAEREARIGQLAYFDALTGLQNRARFVQTVESALAAAAPGAPCAVVMLDLDRFKHVNDVLGHPFGDRVLQAVARRLAVAAQRARAPLARLGGDEFALLLVGRDADAARPLALDLGATMQVPIVLDGHALDLGASVGLASCPEHAGDAATLLARAEIAMYAAKRRRSGPLVYAPALDDSSPENLSLAGELRAAIAGDELVLHYQPKIALADGRLAGAEALVRWQHPLRGFVPPDRFLPFAEQTGAIRDVTRWVLRRAVAQVAAWRDAGLAVPVAVNLSTRDLMDVELPRRIADALATYRLEPAMLTLEITESAIMDDADRALQVLEALHGLGVALSIDDFGTGYSSLAYLKRLPVTELKIDRSFTRHMVRDADDAIIVRSTIDLGHNLGLRVVAEGIEDDATVEALRAAGCDRGQGYRFSRPLAADAFEAWARAWPGAAAARGALAAEAAAAQPAA